MTKFIHSLFVVLGVGFFGVFPNVWAVMPPPDGAYPGYNTAEGQNALFNLTTGPYNTALGSYALYSDTTGSSNTATGTNALRFNNASNNTAAGVSALYYNTSGHENVANGVQALFSNSSGHDNIAIGVLALRQNTVGNRNTAIGSSASRLSGDGNFNVAVGDSALYHNTGDQNIAVGYQAGYNLTTGVGNIVIGNPGAAGDDATIRIGSNTDQSKTFIGGIFNGSAIGGSAVYVTSSGQLGINTSSVRFKEKIKNMGDASDVLLSLRPVTFRYKKEFDPQTIPEFGLVAEEVEKVNADLVVRDADGKPYSVRYEAVNAMLLNEFLKAHRRIEEQDKRIEKLTTQLKQQAALIQKVSDKIEMIQPAAQIVTTGR